jgi:predicted RNA-binding Zn-ribbon protein involved in translation (DUF1610 family)
MNLYLSSATPSVTASVAVCPQCGELATIKLIEPDPKDRHKERHVFECRDCGLPRSYLIAL